MKDYKQQYNITKKLTEQEVLDRIESGIYEEDGVSLYSHESDEDMFTIGDLKEIIRDVPDEYPVYFNEDTGDSLYIETVLDNGQNEIIINITSDSIDEDTEEEEVMDDFEVTQIMDVEDENEVYDEKI